MHRPEATSVAGVALKNNRVLLGKRRPGGVLGGKWEFPGGKVEPGESPEACLRREFQEELAVTVRVGEFLAEGAFRHNGTAFTLQAYRVYLESEQFSFREHTELAWFDLDAVPLGELAASDAGLLPELRRLLKHS